MKSTAEIILEKIASKTGIPDLPQVLSDTLSTGELTSLLLEVYKNKASKILPYQLTQQFDQNRLVRPSRFSPIAQKQLEILVLGTYQNSGFEPVELSPVAPLGVSSCFGKVSQHKILTALRSSEVASDPSNILLLLSVQKSKTSESNTIQLCTVQRVVRTNFFVSEINTPHFILFSSTSLISSSEKEEIAFSAYKNLKTSYAIYQKLFPGSEILFSIKKRSNKPWLADGLVEQFKANQCLPFHVSHQDHPYYEGVQIKTLVRDGDQELEVADAGFTDWARKITGKKDLYYFIHGIGMDRLLSLNSFHESGA